MPGGDGATLTVARRKARIFGCWSLLFHSPHGEVAEVTIAVMTKARWERRWAHARPTMRAVDVGPFIIGVEFRL